MSGEYVDQPQHTQPAEGYAEQTDIVYDNSQQITVTSSELPTQIETIRSLLRPAGAELLGSALFVFMACGAGITTQSYRFTGNFNTVGNITLGVAFSFGLTLFVLCYSIGHISGGHLNFAVTLTLGILRRISILRVIFYFFAQFIGGLIGIGFLKLITPQLWWQSCFAANQINQELTYGHAFLTEFILTYFLVFVVMAACDSNKSNQVLVPFAIGICVFCCHMLALPVDGCSLNPTRSFASAAAASGVSGCEAVWSGHWVYWLAPLLGGPLAGLMYDYCFHEGGGKVERLIDQYIKRF